MQPRRTGALVGAAVLVSLAACGSGSDGTSAPAPPTDGEAPITTAAPQTDDVSESVSTEDPAPGTDPVTDPLVDDSTGDADEPTVSENDPVDGDDPATEEAPAEPVATEAPEAAAPAEPVVGGRLLAADVQPAAQFDGNPFPDLVVEDIGKDTQVNIRNILPSDRPVLLWAWAPH